MTDDKLLEEELQRSQNYEALKSTVKSEVGGEVAAKAERKTRSDSNRITDIASNMREKAVDEIVETENEVELGRSLARVSQIVDYVFFLIYGLLVIRLLLALFAARSGNGFVQFIYSVTDLFYAPFKGIVASPSVEGGFTLSLPIIIALIVYGLLHLAINGLLRIFVHRKTEV
jgi:hypothetical protein